MLQTWAKKIGFITFSIALIAVCVNMFSAPHEIAAGGITGLAILLEKAVGLDRSIVVLVANGAILILTLLFLGKEVFFNTALGAGLLPLFIHIIPQTTLVNDRMLSMLAGSVLFGIAVSILYRHRASSGGTAVPPLILKKYFGLNTSIGLFLSDGFIVMLNLLVFSVDSFFYAIFWILITALTMNYIETGLNKKKMVYIISKKNEQIATDVMAKLNRGVTFVPVVGGYEREAKQMLMITLTGKNYHDLREIVDQHDKNAFLITDTVSDVHGEGFTYESGSV